MESYPFIILFGAKRQAKPCLHLLVLNVILIECIEDIIVEGIIYHDAVSIIQIVVDVLTPPTIEIVGFLGDAARFITKPYLKQRVMRFPTIRYGCSA